MKKVFNYIKSTPLNPIWLIVIFTLIGGLILCLFQDDDKAMEHFLTCVGIGISAAIVQSSLIQQRIQKDNIKIQLFDKRYKIFQTVLDSITLIKRDNWDRYILFSENDISKQVIYIEEELYKSVQLSVCLFDKKMHAKLVSVNNAFCKVAKSYKDMLVANIKNFESHEEVQEFLILLKSHLLSESGLGSKEYEENIRERFPKTYITLIDFSKECDAYLALINKCDIVKDFGKYIIVDKLEK
ncbi:MAG: hypothetical protein RRZ65_02925 [Tannerellaceae bacterium]